MSRESKTDLLSTQDPRKLQRKIALLLVELSTKADQSDKRYNEAIATAASEITKRSDRQNRRLLDRLKGLENKTVRTKENVEQLALVIVIIVSIVLAFPALKWAWFHWIWPYL